MNAFSNAIQTWLVNHENKVEDFKLKKASFFEGRVYLAFDSQIGWQIKKLSFWQQLLRNFLGMYQETHRVHVQRAFDTLTIDRLNLQNPQVNFIVSKIQTIFTLHLPQLAIGETPTIRGLPLKVWLKTFQSRDLCGKDLIALTRVCKDFKRSIDGNKALLIRLQAEKLSESLEKLILPLTNLFNGFYRNTHPMLLNLIQALKQYAQTGRVEQKLHEVNQTQGQGSCLQAETVGETLKAALDPQEHGGFQDTIKAIKMHVADEKYSSMPRTEEDLKHYQEFLKISESVCGLLKWI